MGEDKQDKSNQAGGHRVQGSGNTTYGNVGGDVVHGDKVGGDVVHGDKIGGNKITTPWFEKPETKKQTIDEMEELKKYLSDLRKQITVSNEMDEDEKYQLINDSTNQIKALDEAKQAVETVEVGQSAPKETANTVSDFMKGAEGFVEKVGTTIDKTEKIGSSIKAIYDKAAPIIAKLGKWVWALL